MTIYRMPRVGERVTFDNGEIYVADKIEVGSAGKAIIHLTHSDSGSTYRVTLAQAISLGMRLEGAFELTWDDDPPSPEPDRPSNEYLDEEEEGHCTSTIRGSGQSGKWWCRAAAGHSGKHRAYINDTEFAAEWDNDE